MWGRSSYMIASGEAHYVAARPGLAALFDALDVPLHPFRALTLHAVGDVAVDVQRERRGGVAQIALDGLDIIPALQRCHGV